MADNLVQDESVGAPEEKRIALPQTEAKIIPLKAFENLSGHQAIGFELTKRFACILACYLLVASCSVVYSEHRALSSLEKLTTHLMDGVQSQSAGGPILKREEAESLVKTVYQPYRDAQVSTIEFNKTVIVNVLFPLLTALLGYIFAKGEKERGE